MRTSRRGNYNYHLFLEDGKYVLELKNVQMNSSDVVIGIMVSGAPITIRYSGENNISASEYGMILYASGEFRIEDGDPDSENDSLAVNVTDDWGACGLFCADSLTIHGGNLSSTTAGGSQGIMAANTITVEGGAVVDAEGAWGIGCKSLIISSDSGNVTGTGTVGAGAIGIGATNLYFYADHATLKGSGSGTGHGISTVTAVISGKGTVDASASGNAYALTAKEELTISKGTVNAVATGGGTGIHSESQMKISGDAAVSAAGTRNGIKVGETGTGKLTITDNCQVTAKGGYCGISVGGVDYKNDAITISPGNITISGGTVDASCEGGIGPAMHANTSIAISGGTVNTATPGNVAILTGVRVKVVRNNTTVEADDNTGNLSISGGTVNAEVNGGEIEEWFAQMHTNNNETTYIGAPEGQIAVLATNQLHLTGGHVIADGRAEDTGNAAVKWTGKKPEEIKEPVRYRLSPADEFTISPKTRYEWNDTQTYGEFDFDVRWTVSFEANGGIAVEPQTVKNGEKAVKPQDPVNTGYSLSGWYTDAACSQAYDFDQAVTDDLTLYAKWTIDHYTVTFDIGASGTDISDQTVEYGQKLAKPEDPTREGYHFLGWFTDEECTDGNQYDFNAPVTKDLKLYAKWEPHQFTPWVHTGSHTHECTVCGYKETEECTFGDWTVTKQPTAKAKGEKQRICSKCGYVEKAEIAATGTTDPDSGNTSKPDSSNPQTGDLSLTALWIVLMLAAAGSAFGIIRRRKATDK